MSVPNRWNPPLRFQTSGMQPCGATLERHFGVPKCEKSMGPIWKPCGNKVGSSWIDSKHGSNMLKHSENRFETCKHFLGGCDRRDCVLVGSIEIKLLHGSGKLLLHGNRYTTTQLHNYTTTLHYTTLNYTTLHYTTLHYTTLHYTTFHYTSLHYTTLITCGQYSCFLPNYNIPLHSNTLHYTTLHWMTLHHR